MHTAKNYKCEFMGCIVKIDKISSYVILKYRNCGAKHQATIFKCLARLKAQAKT